MAKELIIFPVVLLLSLSACEKSAEKPTASNPTLPAAASNSPKLEACNLITKEEVAAIQGATILDAQSSENHDGYYLVSLCYYSSQEPNMSVSFAVTQPEPTDPKSNPVDYWKTTFGRFSGKQGADDEAKEKAETEKQGANKKEEEEERVSPPERIEGIGQEAFWAGNRFGGALYVLEKNFILRISVGGGDNAQTKIEKSKALAGKAISRL
ncbi:MAG: hypothetical protein M3128_08215 [Verrucomicrobiota bacterium]|nr:hypothetical protein [Verrucomicrobiota bacterium]